MVLGSESEYLRGKELAFLARGAKSGLEELSNPCSHAPERCMVLQPRPANLPARGWENR